MLLELAKTHLALEDGAGLGIEELIIPISALSPSIVPMSTLNRRSFQLLPNIRGTFTLKMMIDPPEPRSYKTSILN